jgi:hypothetical protein
METLPSKALSNAGVMHAMCEEVDQSTCKHLADPKRTKNRAVGIKFLPKIVTEDCFILKNLGTKWEIVGTGL